MMTHSLKSFALSSVLVANLVGYAGTASALPAIDRLAIKNASPSMIESVQWRWGWGWAAPAVAAGVVTGAVVGSALARPYYYGPGPYYPYYPLRQQAITLRAIMAPRPAEARSPTAAAASGHTTPGQEPISGQMETVTRAPKPLKIIGATTRHDRRTSWPFRPDLHRRHSPGHSLRQAIANPSRGSPKSHLVRH
jgi:hypothetical protein